MLAPTAASPESAGMSKAAFDRIEAHLKHRYIDAGRFPGTQLLVYRRGNIVHMHRLKPRPAVAEQRISRQGSKQPENCREEGVVAREHNRRADNDSAGKRGLHRRLALAAGANIGRRRKRVGANA